MKLKSLAKVFLGLLILAFVFSRIGIGSTIAAFEKASPALLLLVVLASMINFPLGVLNMQLLLKGYKRISYLRLMRHYLAAWAVGIFLPSKIGEFSLVFFLKKEKVLVRHSMIASIFDKLITVIVLLGISFMGIFLIFRDKPDLYILCAVVGLGCAAILAFLLWKTPWRFFSRLHFIKKAGISLEEFQKDFFSFIMKHPFLLFLNAVITFAKWFSMAVATHLLFLAFGFSVPILAVLIINSIVSVASLVPISSDGLGIREGLSFVLFSRFVQDSGIIGAVLIVQLAIKYLLGVALLLSYLFLPRMLKLKSRMKTG